MAEKQITDRQKSAEAVHTAAETHGAAAGDAFAKRYKHFLQKGETMPDIGLAMRLVARSLEEDAKALAAAGLAHEAELRDDVQPRKDRDAAALALRNRTIEIRSALEGVYGVATATAAGFAGETPRDPVALGQHVRGVVNGLGTIKLPRPKVKGAHIDVAATAEELDGLEKGLAKHLRVVKREEREAEETQSAKSRALDAYDVNFTASATLIEAGLLVAGKPELADRVRPSRRRPGVTAGSEEEGDGDPGNGVGGGGDK